jgi:3,4-dihydroxy 2-butanone 4-phosphate synthase/GTP cyclohydrolase II
MATPEMVNFMATHGRGLICTPLTESRCKELELDLMVGKNTAPHQTAFTVSVDYRGGGNTTGISAGDRANTIRALVSPRTVPEDMFRPGHIFPLKAKNGGVLRRTGHTEAAIDLARLAGLDPAGVIVEIMNEDGTMARLPELKVIAKKFDLKLISIEDLIAYRMEKESLIERILESEVETDAGTFKLIQYRQTTTGDIHTALVKGDINEQTPVLVRVHSSFLNGNIFDSCRCTAGTDLYAALKQINAEGSGVVVYMQQEVQKSLSETHRKEGYDSMDAKLNQQVKMDARDYGVGAQILRNIGVSKMKLMSSHTTKRTGLVGYGLEVVEYVKLEA